VYDLHYELNHFFINQKPKPMKKSFTILFFALFVVFAYAQQPQGIIMKASVAPEIDGVLDDVWEDAIVYDIDKPYRTEVPTIGEPGETTWRALWNEDGMFIFLVVNDDNWYPSYITGGNNWEYDKPEIYFDVNYVLNDGQGAMHSGTGHYQVAPGAAEATIDGTAVTQDNGVVYAFLVTNPNYVVEYFVPWSLLQTREGVGFDKTGVMGFDVTIIDRDEGDEARRRMVWANVGAIDESWSNMDDVGLITFDGADAPVYIDQITLVGGEITEDNGTLQIQAQIEPEEATNKVLKWTIENKTGRARVDNTGLVTAILDGLVTVTAEATDGSYEIASVDVTISGQIPEEWELNVIRNGDFSQLNDDGITARFWGGWTDASPAHTVVEGVSIHTPVASENNWNYQFNQNQLQAIPDIPYIFKFKTWADGVRTFTVDFEDTSGNGYNRYGASADPRSAGGRSEWTFDITTEPTWYEFDVLFDQIIETTDQKVQFMLGTATEVVYIDSVLLISVSDMELVTSVPPVNTVETFKVYPNPAQSDLRIVLNAVDQTVAIFNTLGVKVEEVRVSGNEHTFNVSTYPKGIYFIRTENTVMKFIKN
jgi:hypothetical protein